MEYVEEVDVQKSSTSLKRPKLKPVFKRFILLRIPCCAMKRRFVFYYLPAKTSGNNMLCLTKKQFFTPSVKVSL